MTSPTVWMTTAFPAHYGCFARRRTGSALHYWLPAFTTCRDEPGHIAGYHALAVLVSLYCHFTHTLIQVVTHPFLVPRACYLPHSPPLRLAVGLPHLTFTVLCPLTLHLPRCPPHLPHYLHLRHATPIRTRICSTPFTLRYTPCRVCFCRQTRRLVAGWMDITHRLRCLPTVTFSWGLFF